MICAGEMGNLSRGLGGLDLQIVEGVGGRWIAEGFAPGAVGRELEDEGGRGKWGTGGCMDGWAYTRSSN